MTYWVRYRVTLSLTYCLLILIILFSNQYTRKKFKSMCINVSAVRTGGGGMPPPPILKARRPRARSDALVLKLGGRVVSFVYTQLSSPHSLPQFLNLIKKALFYKDRGDSINVLDLCMEFVNNFTA